MTQEEILRWNTRVIFAALDGLVPSPDSVDYDGCFEWEVDTLTDWFQASLEEECLADVVLAIID